MQFKSEWCSACTYRLSLVNHNEARNQATKARTDLVPPFSALEVRFPRSFVPIENLIHSVQLQKPRRSTLAS